MEYWKIHFDTGLLCVAVGIAIFLLPFSGRVASLSLGVSMYLLAFFLAGIGVGVLLSSYTMYRLEKEHMS